MGDGETDQPAKVPRERSGDALEDTIPASEPPTDADGDPMRTSRTSMPPPNLQRYQLGAELGRGGMGRVVEAFDTQLGRTVALKEVLPRGGAAVARRFLREVQITARLEHASIVPLYDSGTMPDGRPYYVMRRVSGRPFDELLTRARGLGERLTFLPALLAAIDAVAHAHRRGVIHRDLKPGNILVGELGETVVIDWGLAKVIGEEDPDVNEPRVPTAADSLQTQHGSVFGTPGFMAPEQARGEQLGTQTDVYALGATLYHLLAGTPPHGGSSATEVLGRTLANDVIPLAEAAPGAPAELIAIVDKALAFEHELRYPHAGALGEDVRRFLAGQLVAAHRYTSRQRLARFAKRHRTVLAIAAAATTVVAALAWFSVHRIVKERDLATQARHAAVAQKHEAEAARDHLAERNDALLVTQARSLLEINPTEALAVLKQLPQTSPRLDDARAIAHAAVARGAWWAIESVDGMTIKGELDPSGRYLLQLTRDHILRVWDLERRRLVIARPYTSSIGAVWVTGGRLFVHGRDRPAELLDPGANHSEVLGLGRITYVVASETGDRVLLRTAEGSAALYDVTSRALVPLWDKRAVQTLEIAPDGSWVVLGDRAGLVVLDAAGAVLTRRAGEYYQVTTSRARSLAVTTTSGVIECKLDPRPAWTPLPSFGPHARVFDLRYRGSELAILLGSGEVFSWSAPRLRQRARVDHSLQRLLEVDDDLVMVATEMELTLLMGASATFRFPSILSRPRVVTRRSSSRVIVIAEGLILGLDLRVVVPRKLPASNGHQALFVDDQTMLIVSNTDDEWAWLDVATRRSTPFKAPMRGLFTVDEIDAATRRVLIHERAGTTQTLGVLRPEHPPRLVGRGSGVWGRLLYGDAVAFTTGEQDADGRVFVQAGTDPPRELVKLDGTVEQLATYGGSGFVAISEHGEVVRGSLTGGIERTRIPVTASMGVGSDAAGRVLILSGDRLLRWEQDIVEVTRFARPITHIRLVGDALVVTLSNREVHLVSEGSPATTRRLVEGSEDVPHISADGKTLVAIGNGNQLSIVELPSGARWSLPPVMTTLHTVSLSPSTRQLVQSTGASTLYVWTLPTSSADFLAWLDEQTNAIKHGDGVLAWPWQLRAP